MSNHYHRLRKYKKRKDRAVGDPKKWNHLAAMYWRYWFLNYGNHECLWGDE